MSRKNPPARQEFDSKNVSVIFRGLAEHRGNSVRDSLKFTKQAFPDAEFIFSTWASTELNETQHFDIVVESNPEQITQSDYLDFKQDNFFRQKMLAVAGLEKSSREIAIVIRSDFFFFSDDAVRNWISFKPVYPEFNIFSKPIGVLSLGCNDPLKNNELFHCSDFLQIGFSEDLKRYWGERHPTVSEYPRNLKVWEKVLFPLTGFSWKRYASEQELILCAMEQSKEIFSVFRRRDSFSSELLRLSEMTLLNSFYLISRQEYKGHMPKNIEEIYNQEIHYDPLGISSIVTTHFNNANGRFWRAFWVRVKILPRRAAMAWLSLVVQLARTIVSQLNRKT